MAKKPIPFKPQVQGHQAQLIEAIQSNKEQYANFLVDLKKFFKHHAILRVSPKISADEAFRLQREKTIFEETLEFIEDTYTNILMADAPNKPKQGDAHQQEYLKLFAKVVDHDAVLKEVLETDSIFTLEYTDNQIKAIKETFQQYSLQLDITHKIFYRQLLKARDRDYLEPLSVLNRIICKKFLWHLAKIKQIII